VSNFYRLIQGDCLEVLPTLETQSIDLIVTDPPYFLPAQHYQTRKQFHRNFSDLRILEHFFKEIYKEFARVIKPSGIIYLFCDGQSYPLFYYHLYPLCKSIRPLIWDKKTSINGYSWRHQHEIIIFAEMPDAKPIPSGDGDILKYSAVKIEERKHPAEKPIDLLIALIQKSSNEENIILDLFAGGGSIMQACQETRRNCLSIELSPEYCQLVQNRCFGRRFLDHEVEYRFEVFGETPRLGVSV